ncbi:MAG: VCBS repeat-containing protein [Phycisphaerales bacterium]
MNLLKALIAAATTGAASAALAGGGTPTLTGPIPYSSIADSPFFATEKVNVDYYLETFELGSIVAPGLTIPGIFATITSPSPTTDSVDLDDCVLDGSGTGGRSIRNSITGTINLNFNSTTLGGYPTRVGFVWTDGAADTTVTITVISADSGEPAASFQVPHLGIGGDDGGTAEDSFFGIEWNTGIAQIQIANSFGMIEVDHIQYDAPTAGTVWNRDRVDAGATSDLGWFNASTGKLKLWYQNGYAKTVGTASATAPSTYVMQGMGDFDGDGDADFLFRDSTTNIFQVWLMNGSTVATNSAVQGTGAVSTNLVCIGVGDTNGDGKADVIFRNTTNNTITIWYMDGVTMTSTGKVVDGNGANMVASNYTFLGTGDFNGDKRFDLLWRNNANNVTLGWLLNGRTVLKNATVGNAPVMTALWEVGTITDLDGDGRDDVVWRKTSNGSVNGWLMNGLYAKANGLIGTRALPWYVAAGADIDGDGKGDLIWIQPTTGAVSGWIMNGLTKVSAGNIGSYTPITPWAISNQ